ncbi:MAG: hypothetical protein ACTSWY_10595 [Promethearchaeota archaeon]
MLTKFSYVFIIGAGGGKPYGFPLGEELYNNICKNYASQLRNYFKNNEAYFPFDVEGFIINAENYTNELKKTTGISIDKYLNVNSIFKQHGIHSIATEIYLSEIKSKLKLPNYQIKPEGDWYTYLFQKLIEGLNTVEDLKKTNENKISFITFNYDRSLEHFLFENLYGLVKNAKIERREIAEIFLKIPFVHVYGKVGYLPWQNKIYIENPNFFREEKLIVSYGSDKRSPVTVGLNMHKMIEIMYGERKDKPELNRARSLISNADRVMFLGFGYDKLNLSILNLPYLLEGKRVYGTAYKATKNEIIHIKSLLGFNKVDKKSEIYNFDCLMLLKEHLI